MAELEASSNADYDMETPDEKQNQENIRCVHLFNCDKTYKLDVVEKLFKVVEKKLNFAFSIKTQYFALRDMSEVCENIIRGQIKADDVAVFVVHAHESRLSINGDNAGIGYARIYRTLLRATEGKLLVVIGGDDNYKDYAEEQGSFLSRWARRKVSSQFSEEYLDGRQSFIFSWDHGHRPIHEEALLHYFDPCKEEKKFVAKKKTEVAVTQVIPKQEVECRKRRDIGVKRSGTDTGENFSSKNRTGVQRDLHPQVEGAEAPLSMELVQDPGEKQKEDGPMDESNEPFEDFEKITYADIPENMEDLLGASVQMPALGGDFPGPSRHRRQHEPNLERQLREMREREEHLQSQLSEMRQREANLQRQLRETQQREKNLQRPQRETQQREENSQRQLSEMQQNSQRQLREMQQREETLRRQLRERDQEVNELELSLFSAQQIKSEQQQRETCDWVISRDEIQMTNKCLGRGGWGSVYEGVYCGCAVAVKQIHDLILSPHNILLFEREMSIASMCRHPHLLQFIGATNDEGNPLFVTELMEKSLRALLEQRQLSETEIRVISLDVARAINYLHQKKPKPIIHRDVSSANVLLWQQGHLWRGKVSDYGTANFMQQTMTVAPGAMIYSAPEALTSNQTVKVDVYSFGVLLCEMCIRQLPDPTRREQQVLRMTNRSLRGLVRRCLQTDPEARPTMQEIIDELSRTV